MTAWIENRLKMILLRPDMWGPPIAVELQILLLVEMWHISTREARESAWEAGEKVGSMYERYTRFLETVLPGKCTGLADRLDLTNRSSERFIEVLRDFIKSEELPASVFEK